MTIEETEKLLNQVKNGLDIDKALDRILRDRNDSEQWHWLFYIITALVSGLVAMFITMAVVSCANQN